MWADVEIKSSQSFPKVATKRSHSNFNLGKKRPFPIGPKVTKYLINYERKLVAKIFQKSPIWSHCGLIIFYSSHPKRRSRGVHLKRFSSIWSVLIFITQTSVQTSVTSVTRFGDILPLWKNLASQWQYFEALFSFRQISQPTLANFGGHCAYFD